MSKPKLHYKCITLYTVLMLMLYLKLKSLADMVHNIKIFDVT